MKFLLLSMVLVVASVGAIEYNRSKVLYEDKIILVTKDGVFSKRTGEPLKFRPAPDWKEEDFFTQQEKYCEKETK